MAQVYSFLWGSLVSSCHEDQTSLPLPTQTSSMISQNLQDALANFPLYLKYSFSLNDARFPLVPVKWRMVPIFSTVSFCNSILLWSPFGKVPPLTKDPGMCDDIFPLVSITYFFIGELSTLNRIVGTISSPCSTTRLDQSPGWTEYGFCLKA